MDFTPVEARPSFQQEVARVQIEDRFAYSKRFVSDYSWWTCDDADIFQRELTSYTLLNSHSIRPQLLHAATEQRQIVIEELTKKVPTGDDIQPFLRNLVTFLVQLSQITKTGLQTYSAHDLAVVYEARGSAAKVNGHLLAELTQQLEEWHKVYGAETAFIHGDMHFGNIFTDGSQVGGIIDFEEAIESLPVFDAANISWSIWRIWGQEGYEYFRRAYEAHAVKLIELEPWTRFCQLREWTVSCYLKECCSEALQEQARSFLCHEEPKSMETGS